MKIEAILITNGGSHPADKWARQTARQIAALIEVDEHSTSDMAVAARKALPRFEVDLANALETHHAGVQGEHRDLLAVAPAEVHGSPFLEDETSLSAAVKEFSTVVASTPFADWGSAPATLMVVRGIIGSHMATIQHIERKQHIDDNAKG